MEQAIEARFPHFHGLFHYVNGTIVGIDRKFEWNGSNAQELKNYILEMATYEMHHISRYVDPSMLRHHVRNAFAL